MSHGNLIIEIAVWYGVIYLTFWFLRFLVYFMIYRSVLKALTYSGKWKHFH